MNYEKILWDYLIDLGFTEQATAGILGNTHAESANKPNNLQDLGNKLLNMTDECYTASVDDGSYLSDKFVHDSWGYGLCQWTYWSRKKALLDFAKSKKVSIADVCMQVDFMVKELKQYGLYKKIVNSTDILYVTEVFLQEFEKPASVIGKTEAEKQKVIDNRYFYSKTIYEKYHKTLEDDLSVLVDFNVIKSPEYWKLHADDLTYLKDLYHNMANVLTQMSEANQ